MNYPEIDPIVNSLDELFLLVEGKLEKERQRVIDSGWDPKADEYQFWYVFQEIYDAYVEELEHIAQARHLVKPYSDDQVKEIEEKYLFEFL